MKKRPTILITCGEASGDLHASILIGEILKRIPDARILAFGGEKVREAGAELLFHIDDFSALIGFSGILTNFPKLARLERGLKRALAEVDLFIPVDYPGLNLRLAERAKQLGVPVLYYIGPQVWAWGKGRVDKISKLVDYMAVILPFEEQIYREKGVPVEFVGHPFVEDHELPLPRGQEGRTGIGLLPGSRWSEIRRILPVLLDAAEQIHKQRPDERFVIGCSRSVPMALYKKIISRHNVDVTLERDALKVMSESSLLLVASGTATLQGALFETPLIIVYRVSMINYLIARALVSIDHIGLVNIVLGERICPEFLQLDAKPGDIADSAIAILSDDVQRESMISRFSELREMLAGGGGCRRVAEISEGLLKSA